MRLIDADALEKEYRRQFESVYKHIRDTVKPSDFYIERKAAYDKELMRMEMEAFCEFLQARPTIEAEPVRHGRWVTDDLGHTHCSRCCERLPFMHCYSEEPCSDYDEEWDEEIPETRYCPNCGAKMDGGAGNG